MSDCGSCKHWDKAERPPRGYEPLLGPGHGPFEVEGDWGTCTRIKHLSGDSHSNPPDLDERTDDPAYLSDGSGYFASLTTRSDFGCTLWESREIDDKH